VVYAPVPKSLVLIGTLPVKRSFDLEGFRPTSGSVMVPLVILLVATARLAPTTQRYRPGELVTSMASNALRERLPNQAD